MSRARPLPSGLSGSLITESLHANPGIEARRAAIVGCRAAGLPPRQGSNAAGAKQEGACQLLVPGQFCLADLKRIFPNNFCQFYSRSSHLPHTLNQQLACGNGWPQPPLRQVWRWSDARWVARVAPVVCRLVRSRLWPEARQDDGPGAGSEKTPAAHGSASTYLLLRRRPMRRFPQWPDAKAGVATMKRAYPFDFLGNPG